MHLEAEGVGCISELLSFMGCNEADLCQAVASGHCARQAFVGPSFPRGNHPLSCGFLCFFLAQHFQPVPEAQSSACFC